VLCLGYILSIQVPNQKQKNRIKGMFLIEKKCKLWLQQELDVHLISLLYDRD
jgi:hypothetical protein